VDSFGEAEWESWVVIGENFQFLISNFQTIFNFLNVLIFYGYQVYNISNRIWGFYAYFIEVF